MSKSKGFELSIRSTPDNIRLIEPFVREVQQMFMFNEDVFFNVLLVLTEAVNNSILHGNGADPKKYVTITLRPTKGALRFEVCDEGQGFDPSTIPDPTKPDRLQDPNGRGVFLMRQLSDKLNYSKCGRRVKIDFAIVNKSR